MSKTAEKVGISHEVLDDDLGSEVLYAGERVDYESIMRDKCGVGSPNAIKVKESATGMTRDEMLQVTEVPQVIGSHGYMRFRESVTKGGERSLFLMSSGIPKPHRGLEMLRRLHGRLEEIAWERGITVLETVILSKSKVRQRLAQRMGYHFHYESGNHKIFRKDINL